MVDLILMIVEEINISTSNLIYFLFGFMSFFIIMRLKGKRNFFHEFYLLATDLYNKLDLHNSKTCLGMRNLYNQIIIRSICIMSLDGEFAIKDRLFVDKSIEDIENCDDIKTHIRSCSYDFLDKVCALEKEMRDDGTGLIVSILTRRKK